MCHVHNDFENYNFYSLHTTFFLRFKGQILHRVFGYSHNIVFVAQKSVCGVGSRWIMPNAEFKMVEKQTIIKANFFQASIMLRKKNCKLLDHMV
jgi:hypothetical protein